MTTPTTAPSSAKLLDLVERCGWTFAQALAAAIYVAGQSTTFAQINWPNVLTGAALAAVLAGLKVAGVNASQAINQVIAAAAVIEQAQAPVSGPVSPMAARGMHERPR